MRRDANNTIVFVFNDPLKTEYTRNAEFYNAIHIVTLSARNNADILRYELFETVFKNISEKVILTLVIL